MPCVMPPWTWPVDDHRVDGNVPTSSTATYRTSRASPVSVSTSTTAAWAPAGHEKFGGSNTAVSSRPGSIPSGRLWAACACERRRLDRHVPIGRALDAERPVLELEVVVGDLELVRDDRARLGDRPSRPRARARSPPDGERSAPVRVHALLRDRGVAVQYLDVVDADAELVGDDLRPRRLVALAVRRRAGHDLHRAERLEADRRAVPAADGIADRAEDARRREAAHLVVRREADADLLRVAARAARRPGPFLIASRSSSSSGRVERRVVVARVDRQARRHRVRELLDEVLAAKLDRIHPELGRQSVHRPLEDVGRLGPPGSAVRVGRRRVREDAGERDAVVRDRRTARSRSRRRAAGSRA